MQNDDATSCFDDCIDNRSHTWLFQGASVVPPISSNVWGGVTSWTGVRTFTMPDRSKFSRRRTRKPVFITVHWSSADRLSKPVGSMPWSCNQQNSRARKSSECIHGKMLSKQLWYRSSPVVWSCTASRRRHLLWQSWQAEMGREPNPLADQEGNCCGPVSVTSYWHHWKDERVSVKDGVAHPYSLKFDRGVEDFPWSTHIVMSSLPADQLPRILKHRGVKPLCVLESCIDHRALTIENPHW